jgi:hypothetical protein
MLAGRFMAATIIQQLSNRARLRLPLFHLKNGGEGDGALDWTSLLVIQADARFGQHAREETLAFLFATEKFESRLLQI